MLARVERLLVRVVDCCRWQGMNFTIPNVLYSYVAKEGSQRTVQRELAGYYMTRLSCSLRI